ncbi:two-component sensor histidine kinase [Clostridium botulinum]|uniref:HAMP domain-containing sensor histidine kinase n=1 Tax=Clostridium botulinum TaxID=1491 RepID=UPI001969EE8F|nr:HAMP domain-containing sensor histidine kinase [Clostridium botulinum]MBN3410322.1 two-component sensor histidine kinase [Clostridium botulinum]MBY6873982.1 HAMP domain-containing histidine kinase [Clostridium botulinum]
MKKILKLKGELVLYVLISCIISFILSIFLKEYVIGSFLNNFKSSTNYVQNNVISTSEYAELKNMDMKDSNKLQKFLDDEFIKYSMSYTIFIVQKNGHVLASTNKEIKTIDPSKIVIGSKKFKFLDETRKNLVKITRCDYLKNGCYLYYIYVGYGVLENDYIIQLMIIIIFIITFLVLIWPKISYISNIKSTIRSIAKGNLYERVNLKYKNELGELAEDVNYMALKIEKEDKIKRQFLTNISHDLRTPLTTMLGYINMIKNNKYTSKDELNNYTDIINKKGLYLKDMLDDFFQYSKLSSKDIVVERQCLELNELARQIAQEYEYEFTQKCLILSLKLPADIIYINIDPKLYLRAINNLLSNALKYSKHNTSVEFTINREKYNNEFYGVVLISNIPNEVINNDELEDFFERLYKKDLSRQNGGSGLGLSIVKNIIKIHGDFIKVYKKNDRLFFKIYIKEIKY